MVCKPCWQVTPFQMATYVLLTEGSLCQMVEFALLTGGSMCQLAKLGLPTGGSPCRMANLGLLTGGSPCQTPPLRKRLPRGSGPLIVVE